MREGRLFKPTILNESLRKINNDRGVKAVNFATSKILSDKSTMFPHHKVSKFAWTSPDGKSHCQTDQVLIRRQKHLSALDVQSFRATD
jgi:hypothetical protein